MTLVEYVQELLTKYRSGLTMERLQEKISLGSKNYQTFQLIQQSPLFVVNNDIVFLKESLIENKEDFLKEFEDYLSNRIHNQKTRQNLVKYFQVFIPDDLYIEWMGADLERKLMIYDLLYVMVIRSRSKKDPLKKYFTRLIEFYSLIIVYFKLLYEYFDEDLQLFEELIEKVWKHEELIKTHLFNLLSVPDIVQNKLSFWLEEFKQQEFIMKKLIESNFSEIKKLSSKLFKRVIENEVNRFEVLTLLTRFGYKNFYDWIQVLIEEDGDMIYQPKHNLFDDLDL